jgi:putative transposase
MFKLVWSLFEWFSAFLRSRNSLGLEIVVLRQQVNVLKHQHPRSMVSVWDQVFWVFLRRVWSRWAEVLVVVKPETVVRWHRAGFRLYWRWLSWRKERGRPRIGSEVRQLIERMARENPLWGAPRIHGELLKMGFDVSERTVSRYLGRVGRKGDARKLWLTFLRNHREVIAAMDFFAVPTATFRVLYCFFVIGHGRRRILHFNATEHPTGPWIGQQLREAFPTMPRLAISSWIETQKYAGEATEVLRSLSHELMRTAYQSPWQNGVAERWVGSCRRELLDHVIVFNETHLRRLVHEYLSYYHEDRIHDSLDKDTPVTRAIERSNAARPRVVAMPRVGGLHHRYTWKGPPDFRVGDSVSDLDPFCHHCAQRRWPSRTRAHSFRSHDRA